MADEKVGTKTGKSTQAGRDVYKTEDGENVSEKSTTFKYKGQWINVPSIHNGYRYDDDTLRIMLDAEVIGPPSTDKNETDAVKAAVERSNNLKFNKGGTPMQRQMELFRDGGLKDEGGMIDKESGNEVPIGGTKEGVRDDIPANVSEGEFVMPADVVRYHGLDKMMQIRQEAKMGLKKMEAMGQMGNSDEATMDDDMPFGMADLIVVGDNDEPMEFADGGFVPSSNYAPGGLTTGATGSGRVGQPVDVEPTAPVIPVDQPATRRLTPEVATAPATKIDFKKLMGEAAIEYKEYRNAAGESMMISFIGGQPAYPIPDGYSLYTGDGAVGSGTAGGTADGIAYAANTATAEYRQSNNDNDDPFKDMPVAKAIDWASLSTEELMAESAKLTGIGSTIAKGAMAFMGPLGAIGYAMMRYQDKKVAQEIANRIAKGGLTAAQLKTLTAAQEKLTPKGFTIIGKIMEVVGNALGYSKNEIEATKTKTSVIDNSTTESAVLPPVIKDLITDPAKNAALVNPSADNMKAANFTEEQRILLSRNIPTLTEINKSNLSSVLTEDLGAVGAEFAKSLQQSYTETDADGTIKSGPADYLDNLREGISTLTPIGETLAQAPARTFRDMSQTEAAFGPASVLPQSFESLEGQYSTTPISESTRLAGDLPGELGPVQFTSTANMPDSDTQPQKYVAPKNYDAFGDSYFTPGTAKFMDESNELLSTSANMRQADKNTSMGRRGILEPDATTNVTSQGPVVRRDLLPESAPVVPAAKADLNVVPPSPVLNIDNRPSGDSRDYQGGSYGYGQTGVAPVATAPVATSDVATQTQQAFNAPAYTGQDSFSFQPPNVNAEITQAFPNTAGPGNTYAGYIPQTGTGSYDEVPTSNEIATRRASDLYKANQAADAIATAKDPRKLGGSEGYGPTPTAQTFSQAFAANRAAGAKTFDYNGKSYTTQTAEEAAPKGSNTFLQSAKNLLTPGDGKEYIDGKLVDSGSSKSKTKTTPTASKNVATSNVVNKTSAPIAKANQSTFGDAGAGNVWAVQPGTNAVTKVKATKVVGSRSKEAVQAEINASYKANGGWTPAVDKLVKEREVAQPAPVVSSNDNDSGNDGGGGGNDTHCCTAAAKRGDMTLTEVKKLRAWHRNKDVFWQEGYDVWGKIVADHLVAKYKWSSDRVRDFYYHKIYGKLTIGSVCADIVIYPMSYAIGMYLHAVNKLTSIKFFKET